MTKFPIRTLIIAYLELEKGDKLLDIGSGTGSISVEGGSFGVEVFSIDKNPEAVKLTKENGKKFNVDLEVYEGDAPKDLPDLSVNKVFVGGSGGNLEDIFLYLEKNLEKNGILVGSFITLKNLEEFRKLLKKYEYEDLETNLFQSAREDHIGLMRGENPIFIVKGRKK